MKKKLFLVFFGAVSILLVSCSGNDSKHIQLNEVVKSYRPCSGWYELDEECVECKPVIDFFSVDPNSCFVSLSKNRVGDPSHCVEVLLKIKLEHNITIKPEYKIEDPKELAEKLAHSFAFKFFNDQGDLLETIFDISLMYSIDYFRNYTPEMNNYEVLELLSNKEKKMDFYLYATTAAPGTEYELKLCAGCMFRQQINAILNDAVGLKVVPNESGCPEFWEYK